MLLFWWLSPYVDLPLDEFFLAKKFWHHAIFKDLETAHE